MKAITVKQPYASLCCKGIKDIENRTWATKYRGRILIHAAAKPVKIAFEVNGQATAKEIKMCSTLSNAEENNLFGCIIGSVEIIDCVINHASIWAEKTEMPAGCYMGEKIIHNWVLANAIEFPEPIPVKGKLSFWDYPNILAEPEEKDGLLFCHCQLPVKEEIQVMSLIDHFSCRYCGGKWYK